MKSLLIIPTLILISTLGIAQKKQNVYFFKNDGREVNKKESADYIRVIQEPDSGSRFFRLFEYYKDGAKKRVGMLSTFSPTLKFEESVISYYPNGNKQEISTYRNGNLVGERYLYYPNAQLEKVLAVQSSGNQLDPRPKSKLISFFDSTGTQLVKDGDGYYRKEDTVTAIFEEGRYKSGYKDSVWTGHSTKNNYSYTESFANGKLVSGTVVKDGVSTSYTEEESLPVYPGGMDKFYAFVGRTFRYPREAIGAKVSGRITLSFVVEKDGTIVEQKVLRDIGYGTGAAALDVISRSARWVPGKQHGIPVRVQYTLPIILQSPQ